MYTLPSYEWIFNFQMFFKCSVSLDNKMRQSYNTESMYMYNNIVSPETFTWHLWIYFCQLQIGTTG